MLGELYHTSKPFLVIGRAGMDLYPDPPGSQTEHAHAFFPALGGSSANIAVALCRLGQAAELVTCVSDDAVGRYAVNQLKHYGVQTRFVRSVAADTRTSLAVVESRVQDHQSVIYRNNAADFQMDKSDFAAIDWTQYCAVVATGTCLTKDPSRSATLQALEQAKAAGLPTIMDLDYRPYSWAHENQAKHVYHQALDVLDVIVGNDDEFGHMAGHYDQGEDFARLLADKGKVAIYKMGERGSRTFTPDQGAIDTGIIPVTPLKPTGAGDSFLGGLMASLCRQGQLTTALVHGSAGAAMVVTRVGCAPAMPDLADLHEFLAHHAPPSQTLSGEFPCT